MQNLKLLLGVIGGTVAMVFAIAFLFTSSESNEPKLADPALTEADRRHVLVATMEETSEETSTQEETSEEAPEATESDQATQELVTIVEFSDFQCPACQAASGIVKSVMRQYPGQVELVYRQFPLETIHQNARLAAVYSEAIAQQDLFWEFHDVLFENQGDWAELEDPSEAFVAYAQEIGADTEVLSAAVSDTMYDDLVEEDVKDGFALGVNSTPTFYVEGEKVSATELSEAVAARL